MSAMEALAAEVDRIVLSRYPVSLKTLDSLLDTTSVDTVQRWIDGYPCRAGQLAAAVRESLQSSPISFRILNNLCQSASFRYHILRHDPGILNALLAKAITSGSTHDFNKYAPICVKLLSEPLPQHVPLPASTENFLLSVFQQTAQSPCVGNLGRLYALITGACRELVDLVEEDYRTMLQTHLHNVLKRFDPAEASWFIMLYTLGIYLSCSGHVNQSLSADAAAPNRIWNFPGAKDLVIGSKALKTIQYIVLCVVFLLSGKDDSRDAEVIDGIRIASRVLDVFAPSVRHTWLERHRGGTDYFNKLVEKSLSHANPAVRLEAFGFVSLFDQLPTSVIEAYSQSLGECQRFSLGSESAKWAFRSSLARFAPRLSKTVIAGLLQQVFEACVRPQASGLPESLQEIVLQLTSSVADCQPLRSGIMAALRNDNTKRSLQQYLEVSFQPAEYHDSFQGRCNVSVREAQRQLVLSTVTLLLKTALLSHSSPPILDPEVVVRLLEKQTDFSKQVLQCVHQRSAVDRQTPILSVFEEGCTPQSSVPCIDWQARLSKDLKAQTDYQRDMILKSVRQICQDLETRCEDNEGPLRLEEEKSRGLQAAIDELRQQNEDLKAQAIDRELFVDGLEAERFRQDAELQRVESENLALRDSLEELQTRFRDANAEADRTLELSRREFQQQEQLLQATLAAKDDILDGQNCRIHHLEADLTRAHDVNQNLSELLEELREKSSALENEVQEGKSHAFENQQKMDSLKVKLNELNNQLAQERAALESAHNKQTELQQEQERQIKALEDSAREASHRYETELQNASAKANEMQKELESRLETLHAEMCELRGDRDLVNQELKSRHDEIRKLKRKAKQLQELCIRSEAEASHLRQQHANMLAALGFNNAPGFGAPEETRAPLESPKRHRKLPSRRSIRMADLQDRSSAQLDEQTQHETQRSFESVASSIAEPLPKRTKARKAFKVPTLQPRVSGTGSRIGHTFAGHSPETKRAALLDVSAKRGNLSPVHRRTIATFAGDEKEKPVAIPIPVHDEEGAEEEDPNEDFEGSDILTSTPLITGPVGDQAAHHTLEESTTRLF